LGHEICGEVVSVGENINTLHPGQQVAVIPYVACRQCPACLSGRTNCCEAISVIGVHQDGGFSEYLSVPVTNLLRAEGIDPEAALDLRGLGITLCRRLPFSFQLPITKGCRISILHALSAN
jgi:threonine dehydrogenase-like Zn-dependent dehydrogenase